MYKKSKSDHRWRKQEIIIKPKLSGSYKIR